MNKPTIKKTATAPTTGQLVAGLAAGSVASIAVSSVTMNLILRKSDLTNPSTISHYLPMIATAVIGGGMMMIKHPIPKVAGLTMITKSVESAAAFTYYYLQVKKNPAPFASDLVATAMAAAEQVAEDVPYNVMQPAIVQPSEVKNSLTLSDLAFDPIYNP